MAAFTAENPEQEALQIGTILQKLANDLHLDNAKLKLDNLQEEEELIDAFADISLSSLETLVQEQLSWTEAGTDEMVMVTDQDPTLYMLMHLNASGTKMNGMAVLLGKHWYDLSAFVSDDFLNDIPDSREGQDSAESSMDPEQLEEQLTELTMNLLSDLFEEEETEEQTRDTDIGSLLDTALGLADYFLADEEDRPSSIEDILLLPARTEYLPTKGLEEVKLAEL